MLDIASTTHPDHPTTVILRLSGDIDSSNYQIFQKRVDEELAKGGRYFLLNFANVSRITSAGLRVIHNLFNNLRSLHNDINDDELRRLMSAGAYKSPHLKLTNLTPHVIDVFRLGGFEIYLDLFEDEAAAVNSFPNAAD